MTTPNTEHLSIFTKNNIPVVLFDRYFEKGRFSKVVFEDKNGAFNLTQNMIDGGCKKVYHLTGDLESQIYKQRNLGYREALKKNDLKFQKSFVRSSNLNKEDAIKIIKAILNEKGQLPYALVCGNDISALAIMKCMDENTSIKVPEDTVIGGFSNEPSSDIIKHGLITIDQHPFSIGKTAAEMLLNFIDDKEKAFLTSNTVVVRSELIVGGSTKKNKSSSK